MKPEKMTKINEVCSMNSTDKTTSLWIGGDAVKPINESTLIDLPMSIDCFHYYAAAVSWHALTPFC